MKSIKFLLLFLHVRSEVKEMDLTQMEARREFPSYYDEGFGVQTTNRRADRMKSKTSYNTYEL